MWPTRKELLFTLIIGVICVVGGGFAGLQARKLQQAQAATFPSQVDIQTHLVDEGYDIGPKGIDGHIGVDTRLAWDKYILETRFNAQDNSGSTE